MLTEIVRATIFDVIEPALPDGRAKLMAQAAHDLLGDILALDDAPPQTPWPEALARLPAEVVDEGQDGNDPAARLERILKGQLGRMDDAARVPATADWLRDIARLQETAIEHAPSLASGYALSASGSLPGYQAPAMLSTRLEQFFRAHPELTDGATSVAVKLLGGGSSKSSFLVTCTGGTRDRSLVVRRDGPYLPLDSSVVDEFPLFKFLEPAGLPIPLALHLETDTAICGSSFIVFEKSEGDAGPAGWGTPEEVRSTAIELAGFLARLHALPVADLVAEPPQWLNPLHLCRSVEGMEAFWQRIKHKPEPLMEAILAWLKANQPAVSGPPVLVHGDAAFHNVLAAGGHISAVLDWEVAHLGQPEEDLGYLHPFVSAAMPWEDFYRAYRDAGGGEVMLGSQRFYSVLAFARITLSVYNGLHAVQSDKAGLDTKDAWIASRYADRFMVETYKRIVE